MKEPHSNSLKMEAWRRLANYESLKGLALSKKDGRVDLSGLQLPEPEVLERFQTALADVARIKPNDHLYSAKLENLDFTGSRLPSLGFSDCEINNCRFDRCDLKNLRLLATTVCGCSFRGADLRGTALGVATLEGPFRGRRNIFSGVDFSEADMRETVYVAAGFDHCHFRNTNLTGVSFGTSTFVDCTFEGELREVRFWDSDLFTRGYPEDAFPVNRMLNVDFSRARLVDVEFRRLTLNQTRLPIDDEHIIVNNFADVLDKILLALAQGRDETSRILMAYFGAYRKWAVAGARGVLNKQSLAVVGNDAVERAWLLLQRFGSKPSSPPSSPGKWAKLLMELRRRWQQFIVLSV